MCSSCLYPHSLLLGFMREEEAPLWKGYFYATLMFLLSCLQSLFNHQYMYSCFTVGMRVKTAVMGLVYRKVEASLAALDLYLIFFFFEARRCALSESCLL